jgi:DNA-binding response OmpR family regulator
MHVVVVDDEPRMVKLITRYLTENGVRVTGVHDGASALLEARQDDVDAVVLDLMLPGISGTEVCQRLRREGNDVPILMLTARGAVAERVAGLEAGADDYLVKPFALEELLARLRALHRRLEPEDSNLVVGDVVMDEGGRRAWVAGEEVALSRREFDMLRSLMANHGRVVSRSRLYDDVWDLDVDISSNTIDVHMSRVRRALATSAQVSIRTLRGVGYRLERNAR